MNPEELAQFAALLVRHLATVIANEQGYTASRCPGCSDARSRRGSMAPSTPGMLFGADDDPDRLAIASNLPAGACAVCHGGGRVWARPGRRMRPMSDRDLINASARTQTACSERERPRG